MIRFFGRTTSVTHGWQVLAIALILIASASTHAGAAVMSYQYGGVISSADPSTGIAAGTRFSGTFTYDTKDLSNILSFEGYQSYQFGNPQGNTPTASGLTFSIGSLPIGSIRGGLSVSLYESAQAFPFAPPGQIQPRTDLTIGTGDSNTNPIQVSLALSNPKQTIYPSLELPHTISLADFPSAILKVYSNQMGNSVNNPLLVGTIDTLTPIPTPEPSTAVVLGVAVAAWFLRSRHAVFIGS